LNKKLVVEVVGCAWDSLWNYGNLKAKMYAPILTYRMKKAVKNGVTKLSVNKSNIAAIEMYNNFGFKGYDSDDNMIYMKISNRLNENLNKIIII
jgi:hypothetical protein